MAYKFELEANVRDLKMIGFSGIPEAENNHSNFDRLFLVHPGLRFSPTISYYPWQLIQTEKKSYCLWFSSDS